MKLIQGVLRAANLRSSRWLQRAQEVRAFSASPTPGSEYNQSTQSNESADDFERRIFGDTSEGGSNSSSFFQKLDRIEKAHGKSAFDSKFNVQNRSEFLDGLDESFNTLSDGMDGKLKQAATYFEFDADEIMKEDYRYRPDVSFPPYSTYDTKDLDLRKPGIRKAPKRNEFEVTTKEVLRKADFRNIRFLANFITEAGIIIKRSKTRISAKAQRKVAREIKTARAFGLMPFTTMGTKHFVFGRTMETLDEDFEYETYQPHNFVDSEATQDTLGGE